MKPEIAASTEVEGQRKHGKRKREEEEEEDSKIPDTGEDSKKQRMTETEYILVWDKDDTSVDILTKMPSLVQDLIVDYLSVQDKANAAQVHPNWTEIFYRPYNCRKVRATLHLDTVPEGVYESWMNREVKHVEVRNCSSREVFLKFVADFPNLVTLDISHLCMSQELLTTIFSEDFFWLEKLSLWVASSADAACWRQVFQHLPELKDLELKTSVTKEVLAEVCSSLPDLRSLSLCCTEERRPALDLRGLASLTNVQELSLKTFKVEGMECFQNHFSSLEKLRLVNCSMVSPTWEHHVGELPLLKELCVLNCCGVTQAHFNQLGNCSNGLTVIHEPPCVFDLHELELGLDNSLPELK